MMRELSKLNVNIIDKEPTGLTPELVKEIFGTLARVLSYETENLIIGKRENGWVHGGSESWYQVALVKTGMFGGGILVAMKSIVSLGDIRDKVLEEATRLALLGNSYAPEIYAVTPASIVKEFLVEDDYSLGDSQRYAQLCDLSERMSQFGLWIQGGIPALASHTIQTQGRLKLLDAGTGDISGQASF
jgi:hypothetical protein